MHVYVSCLEPDETLAARLREAGHGVTHSVAGADLEEALGRSHLAVLLIDRGWSSSTWMGIEAEEVYRWERDGDLQAVYFYDTGRDLQARGSLGMSGYLRRELPADLGRLGRPLRLVLCDRNPGLVESWEREFHDCPQVEVCGGDLLLREADALVSPANSFGFMDGGLDWTLREHFPLDLERRVRRHIARFHAGELLVGQAFALETGAADFPWLICAPTMRVPQDVSGSVNAYLAMRAILRCAQSRPEIGSVAIPGLATGVGRIPYPLAARQMRAAYDEVVLKNRRPPASSDEAAARHRELA